MRLNRLTLNKVKSLYIKHNDNDIVLAIIMSNNGNNNTNNNNKCLQGADMNLS